jgi:hypothetical protein
MLRRNQGNVSYHGHSIGVEGDYQLPAGFDAPLVRSRSTSTTPGIAVSQISKQIADGRTDDRMARLNRKAPLPASCEPVLRQ